MHTKFKRNSVWNRSSSISERKVRRSLNTNWDELTNRRFERWKSLVESDEGIRIEDVLATQNIDEETLKHTINAKEVEFINEGDHQGWLEIIQLVDEQSYKNVNIEVRKDI
ncbi:type 2 lantipeptide synthetase LanM, partial [Bacillus velezensis]